MAIKVGFYGAPCYDLILYVSRILYGMGKSVLLIDLSQDQSLTCSIPLSDDYDGEEFDYRGVTFTLSIPEYMGMDYEVVLIYFGNSFELLPVDYAFCVTTAEFHVIAALEEQIPHILFNEQTAQGDINEKLAVCFARNTPNILALGAGVDLRFKYIASQLNVSKRDMVSVDFDEYALRCRISCQYDVAFRFLNLSSDYKELIYRICCTLCNEELDMKTYKSIFNAAGKGR